MIKISIDESSALDILSIYQLKIIKSDTQEKQLQNEKNFVLLKTELSMQLGKELFSTIMESNEYKQLYEANRATFDVVDKAKTNEVLADEVDKCNHRRYLCKNEIQKKYFGTNLTETKIGYEKLKF